MWQPSGGFTAHDQALTHVVPWEYPDSQSCAAQVHHVLRDGVRDGHRNHQGPGGRGGRPQVRHPDLLHAPRHAPRHLPGCARRPAAQNPKFPAAEAAPEDGIQTFSTRLGTRRVTFLGARYTHTLHRKPYQPLSFQECIKKPLRRAQAVWQALHPDCPAFHPGCCLSSLSGRETLARMHGCCKRSCGAPLMP